MKVTIHKLYDQLCGENNRKIFGLNEVGDKAIRKYISENQEWRGGERLEHGILTSEITFRWDMTEEEFRTIHDATPDDYADDMCEYEGALFFGNFKLEFIKNDISGCYCNLFQYGVEDKPDMAYDYLEDGTPYEECYPICDEIRVPHRRTFESFAENVEQQVIDMLNRHPEFIMDAVKLTAPAKWYPGEREKYLKDFSREA